MTEPSSEFRPINTVPVETVAYFFRTLSKAGYEVWFSPHPFTDEEAERLVNYSGKDYFTVLMQEGEILAYGMLRGWDEGYSVPSLGIATSPCYRGRGLGRVMMQHLHEVARSRNATETRLTVNIDNMVARALYESLGYVFEPLSDDRLLGKNQL